jgi:hypothetical protein
MLVVEPERKPPVRAPVELVDGQPLAIQREHHREVPRQNVHAEVAATFHHFVQEVTQLLGVAVVRARGHEPDTAVDVPADDEDAALRLGNRLAHRGEVVGAVDQKTEALRAFDAPAVAAGNEQSLLGLGRRCRLIHESIDSGGAAFLQAVAGRIAKDVPTWLRVRAGTSFTAAERSPGRVPGRAACRAPSIRAPGRYPRRRCLAPRRRRPARRPTDQR